MILRFVQKELKDTADINAGNINQVTELLKLAFILSIVLFVVYLIVGLIVDTVVSNISVDSEKQIFRSVSHLITQDNTLDNKYKSKLVRLNKILVKITQHPDVPSLDYHLVVQENNKINAFAVPGGKIILTTALVDSLKSDVSYAFVLGHELGHFKNRDHLKGIGRAIGIRICFALVFGNSGGEPLSANAINLLQKKYSRIQEEKADEFGVKLVYYAYGKTKGMDKLFNILKGKNEIPNWAYMFSTHPNIDDRISNLKKYAKEIQQEK